MSLCRNRSTCGSPPITDSTDLCHGADPQSERIIEKLCGYAQDDLAFPLVTEAALTGEQVDVGLLNSQATSWCAEVNAAGCCHPDKELHNFGAEGAPPRVAVRANSSMDQPDRY